ncbi:MAG: hypothetical protein ACHQNT_08535 [Bacteroidia bacterium]
MATKIISREILLTIYKTSAIAILVLIAYFMIIKLIGWSEIVELRFFNVLVMLFAIKHIVKKEIYIDKGGEDLLTVLMYGVFTSIVISAGFSAFIFFNLSYADVTLMQHIKETQLFGAYLNPLSASLVTFLEGVVSGVVVSFIWFQRMNKA